MRSRAILAVTEFGRGRVVRWDSVTENPGPGRSIMTRPADREARLHQNTPGRQGSRAAHLDRWRVSVSRRIRPCSFAPNGKAGQSQTTSSLTFNGVNDQIARFLQTPVLGAFSFVALEKSLGNTPTFQGTSTNMILSAAYRG
jgi:hypothetical protein